MPDGLPLVIVILTATLGLSYGAQSALFAGLFPTNVRYSGSSLAYAFGAILGGGFAPFIATWLVLKTGTGVSVGVYMLAMVAISLVASIMIRPGDMVGLPHGPEAAVR